MIFDILIYEAFEKVHKFNSGKGWRFEIEDVLSQFFTNVTQP